ncbi:MAG: hypothetical protein KKE23_04430 [Nanoarchaeota archaeon]|nr:hypothetical protein [Nanoarchaeota archaeon]
MEKRYLLALLILGVFILSLNFASARVLTPSEQAQYTSDPETPINCVSMRILTSDIDSYIWKNCRKYLKTSLGSDIPSDLRDAIASTPDSKPGIVSKTWNCIIHPLICTGISTASSSAKKPGIVSKIWNCIWHPINCIKGDASSLSEKNAKIVAEAEKEFDKVSLGSITPLTENDPLEQKKPDVIEQKEIYDLSYWKITFKFDKEYFSEFGVDKKPVEYSVLMKCNFEDPYNGECYSPFPGDFIAGQISLKDSYGNIKKCELPLKFSLNIKQRFSNNVYVKADAEITGCSYSKFGNPCSLKFIDCYAPSTLGMGLNPKTGRVRTKEIKVPGEEGYVSDLPVLIEGGELRLKIMDLAKRNPITQNNIIIKPTAAWSAERISSIPGALTTVSAPKSRLV